MSKVAVVGIGLIDTLGSNHGDCFKSLLDHTYKDPESFVTSSELGSKQKVFMPCITDLNLPANMKRPPLESYARCALHTVMDAISELRIDTTDVAVVTSNATTGEESMAKLVNGTLNDKKLPPSMLLQVIPDYLSGAISQSMSWHGPNLNINASCSGSSYALDYAITLTKHHRYVVCTGAECPTEINVPAFAKIGALGTHSVPFDDHRDGFIMGGGAGTLILQSEEYLDHEPIAWINTPGFYTDIHSQTAPDPEGKGAKSAMIKALSNANTNTDDLSFILAHGTSTPLGDIAEYNAIKDIVLPHAIPITSLKAYIGHTLSASTITEIIYGINALRENIVLGNTKSHNISMDEHNLIPRNHKTSHKKSFMKNSFGFGGKCASHIVELK